MLFRSLVKENYAREKDEAVQALNSMRESEGATEEEIAAACAEVLCLEYRVASCQLWLIEFLDKGR